MGNAFLLVPSLLGVLCLPLPQVHAAKRASFLPFQPGIRGQSRALLRSRHDVAQRGRYLQREVSWCPRPHPQARLGGFRVLLETPREACAAKPQADAYLVGVCQVAGLLGPRITVREALVPGGLQALPSTVGLAGMQ